MITEQDFLALALANAALAELEVHRRDLQARIDRHAAARGFTPPLGWQAQSDQLAAEVADWSKALAAAEAVGNPVRDRVRAVAAALCAPCRAATPVFVGAVRGGGAAPCPACGR